MWEHPLEMEGGEEFQQRPRTRGSRAPGGGQGTGQGCRQPKATFLGDQKRRPRPHQSARGGGPGSEASGRVVSSRMERSQPLRVGEAPRREVRAGDQEDGGGAGNLNTSHNKVKNANSERENQMHREVSNKVPQVCLSFSLPSSILQWQQLGMVCF